MKKKPRWDDIQIIHYRDDLWRMSMRHLPSNTYVQGTGESYYTLRYNLYAELARKVRGYTRVRRRHD